MTIPGIVFAFLLIVEPPTIYYFLLIPVGLLFLLIKLPESLRKTYLFVTKKPALVIDKQFLIDNFNGQKFKWADIFEITFNEKRQAISINIGDVNIEKYANNERWFLAKWLTKFDLGISHGTFFIGKQFTDINNTALDNLVKYHNLTRTGQANYT